MREKKKPELLMPAGSLELLKTVIAYGADAVYLGGETMSLRAKAQNFTIPEIKEGIRYAHEHGAKVYVAANIFAHNDDMKKAMKFFLPAEAVRTAGCADHLRSRRVHAGEEPSAGSAGSYQHPGE